MSRLSGILKKRQEECGGQATATRVTSWDPSMSLCPPPFRQEHTRSAASQSSILTPSQRPAEPFLHSGRLILSTWLQRSTPGDRQVLPPLLLPHGSRCRSQSSPPGQPPCSHMPAFFACHTCPSSSFWGFLSHAQCTFMEGLVQATSEKAFPDGPSSPQADSGALSHSPIPPA